MKKAYHGGGGIYKVIGTDFEHIERSKDAINADGLDAWFDPSPKALAKLSENLSLAVKTSPPIHSQGLIETISRYRNIPRDNIVVSGGSSDLMFALFPQLTLHTTLILDPMYGEYNHIFSNVLNEVEVFRYELLPENDFHLQIDDFIDSINRVKPDLVMIVNPNSPAGKFLRKKEIITILENIPEKTMLFVDETYVDYCGSQESVETEVPGYKNLLVIKSMSKVYSLSGARVGYLVAPTEMVERIERLIPPFAVSTPAQILAIEALKDTEYYEERWRETKVLREDLIKNLESIPEIKVYAGEGNFILIELLGKNIGTAESLLLRLAEQNVFIRNADSMSNRFNSSFVRIAIKNAEMNKKIEDVLKDALQ